MQIASSLFHAGCVARGVSFTPDASSFASLLLAGCVVTGTTVGAVSLCHAGSVVRCVPALHVSGRCVEASVSALFSARVLTDLDPDLHQQK